MDLFTESSFFALFLQQVRFTSEIVINVTTEGFCDFPTFKMFFNRRICSVFECMNYHKRIITEFTKHNLITRRVIVIVSCAINDSCIKCHFLCKKKWGHFITKCLPIIFLSLVIRHYPSVFLSFNSVTVFDFDICNCNFEISAHFVTVKVNSCFKCKLSACRSEKFAFALE